MASDDNTDCNLLAERACAVLLLARWRRELLADETEGDADAMERDRRILDYYLDQYQRTAPRNT
jgi:hypothetical protein